MDPFEEIEEVGCSYMNSLLHVYPEGTYPRSLMSPISYWASDVFEVQRDPLSIATANKYRSSSLSFAYFRERTTGERWIGKASGEGLRLLLEEILAGRLYAFYGVPVARMGLSEQSGIYSEPIMQTLLREQVDRPLTHLMSRWLERFNPYGKLTHFNQETGIQPYFSLEVLPPQAAAQQAFDYSVLPITLPEQGLGHILAVAHFIRDIDVIGGEGGNVGYYLRLSFSGELVAESCKIDPGYSFYGLRDPTSWCSEKFQLATMGFKAKLQTQFEYLPLRTRIEFITTLRQIIATPQEVWCEMFNVMYRDKPLHQFLEPKLYAEFLVARQEMLKKHYASQLEDKITYPITEPLPQPPEGLSHHYYHLWQDALYQQSDVLMQQQRYFYVPLDGLPTAYATNSQRKPLEDYFEAFLKNSKRRVWLLLGDAGAGKSTAVSQWVSTLWEASTVIPGKLYIRQPWRALRVNLNRYHARDVGQCIFHTLRDVYHWSDTQIKAEQTEPWVFFLDGYDEIGGHPECNLYESHELGHWLRSKLVITCRSQDPRSQKLGLFAPTQGELVTTYVASLIPIHIEQYLRRAEVELPAGWLIKNYALLSNPFVLRLSKEVLPTLFLQETRCLRQTELYTVFLERWFDKAYTRLSQRLNEPQPLEVKAAFYQFFEGLGLRMFHCQTSVAETHDERFIAFFQGPENNEARLACPLHYAGDHKYQFIHKAYQDYAAAQGLISLLLVNDIEKTTTQWQTTNIVQTPAVVRFLKESIEAHQEKAMLLKQLWGLVEVARHCKPDFAGSNALTLLNVLGERLSGKDFSDLHAPGVDLTESCLAYSLFQRAHLRGGCLRQSILQHSDFSHADLDNVVWGQLPNLQLQNTVWSIACAPDGKHVALAIGQKLELYEIVTGNFVRRMEGHTDQIYSIQYALNGQTLASGSADKSVRVWSASTGQWLYSLVMHGGGVTSVCYAPDGQTLASGSKDKTIIVWQVQEEKGQCLKQLQGHTDAVMSVSYAPNGQRLVSGSRDKQVRIWEIATGQCVQTLSDHCGAITRVSYAPDGQTLASASLDRTVREWEAATGKCLKTLEHTDGVNSLSYASDGQTLVSSSRDKTVRIWMVTTGECLQRLQGHAENITSVCYTPDGQIIVSGGDVTVRMWLVAMNQSLQTLVGHSKHVTNVSYVSNGEMVASGSKDNTVRVWMTDTAQCQQCIEVYMDESMSYALNDQILVSGSRDEMIRVWDMNTGECLKTLAGHTGCVTSISYSPDGEKIVSGSYDKTVRVWSIATGQCLQTLKEHSDWVTSVSYAPDGQTVVSGSKDSTIRVWDVSTGRCLQQLQGHSGSIESVSYAPNGETIASGGWDNTVRIWVANRGKCLKQFDGHLGSVESISYRPDGQIIASGSMDTTVRVWNVDTGRCVQILSYHRSSVNTVAFNCNGWLVSGGADNAIAMWNEKWQLVWATHRYLDLKDMNITAVAGLTSTVRRLLEQGGAIVEPTTHSLQETQAIPKFIEGPNFFPAPRNTGREELRSSVKLRPAYRQASTKSLYKPRY